MLARHRLLALLLGTAAGGVVAAESVTNSFRYQLNGSDYVFYRGDVRLPSPGPWEVAALAPPASQVYLLLPEGAETGAGRLPPAEIQRRVNRGRQLLAPLHWPCREYAAAHGGLGPSRLGELDPARYPFAAETATRSPFGSEAGALDGPFVFLVPGAAFPPSEDRAEEVPAQPLAFELRPYADDGKHWILFTSGRCTREPIDLPLMAKHGIGILPVVRTERVKPLDSVDGRLVAICHTGSLSRLALSLTNAAAAAAFSVTWDLSESRTNEAAVVADLKAARIRAWRPYAFGPNATVIRTWLSLYESPVPTAERGPRGNTPSLLGLFGGRAAVQETLQMEVLSQAAVTNAGPPVSLSSLKGVEVRSHPYETLLGSLQVTGIPLADFVPPDRLFVSLPDPRHLAPLLDGGGRFLSEAGIVFTGSGANYDLTNRYLSRLGLSEPILRLLTESGLLREVSIFFDDLFLIDGTDVTVLARVVKPEPLAALLKQAGWPMTGKPGIVPAGTNTANTAVWTLSDDLLVIGTHRPNVEAVLKLKASKGAGSLGQSAEFRYMLSQLPMRAVTRLYAYLSDPFIRRMVGPATKIAQSRRLAARADMEQITAGFLLSRLDGFQTLNTVAALSRRGYMVETRHPTADYAVSSQGIVSSPVFGSLAALTPLGRIPVDTVTAREAAAYRAYMDNYSRYWRQYFDPIAMRLDDAPGGSLELSTFVLPLVDSTAYNTLRSVLSTREDGAELRTPGITPEPVAVLSLNLKDDAWAHVASGLAPLLSRHGPLDPAVLGDLGPGVHLAIHDANPVVALGSGDILGAFQADAIGLGARSELIYIPIALSLLTRPCTLLVESRNPGQTLRLLRQMRSAPLPPDRRRQEATVSVSRLDGRDAWVCSLDLMGAFRLRYGIEMQGGYLAIRNLPWSQDDQVARVDTVPLNGAAIQASPPACQLQFAALEAAAQDRIQRAAVANLGCLYPLLAANLATPDSAPAAHGRWFGFAPIHPPGGSWTWDGIRAGSSTYGWPWDSRVPRTQTGTHPTALFRDLEYLCINMGFEQTGLRTLVRWKPR